MKQEQAYVHCAYIWAISSAHVAVTSLVRVIINALQYQLPFTKWTHRGLETRKLEGLMDRQNAGTREKSVKDT